MLALDQALVDAVGIEVDGVDLAAGLAEGSVVAITAELARAVARLSGGARRDSVAFRGDGVVLLLDRRDDRIGLSLVRLDRPAAVLMRGVQVDLAAFRRATLDCGIALLRELRAINPALSRSQAVRQLSTAVARLGEASEAVQRPSRQPALQRQSLRGGSGTKAPSCRFELSDAEGLLRSFSGGARDLPSLLVPGVVTLRLAARAPLLRWEGHPFLALRELSESALGLVRAVRDAEPRHRLTLGDAELDLDLERGTGRFREGNELECAPLPLASSLLRATSAFAEAVALENPRQRKNGYLSDLSRSAEGGRAEIAELSPPSARRPSRPPASGTAPPSAEAAPPIAPAPGRLRRVAFRRIWSVDVRGITGLCLGSKLLVASTERGAVALSPGSGALRWRSPPGIRPFEPLPDGGFVATAAGGLARLDVRGRVRWQSSPWGRGAEIDSSCVHGEVAVAASEGEIVALSLRQGDALWRFSPPGCSSLKLSISGPELVAATSDGRLYGIDPRAGRLLFRARTNARPLGPPLLLGGRAFLPTQRPEGALLACVDLRTGRLAPLEQPALGRTGGIVAAGPGLALAGSAAGEGVVVGFTPEGQLAWRFPGEGASLGPGVPQLVRCPEGLLVRGSRETALLGEDGRPRWRRAFEEEVPFGPLPLARRGVALLPAERGLAILDLTSGRLLGTAGERHLVPDWIALDDELSIYCAEEEGPVVAFSLGTFLSIV